MKSRKLFWMYFVMLTAPVCLYAGMVMAISGMGGAYDHSWIGTALGVCFPIVWTYWLVAAAFWISKVVMAILDKNLEDGDLCALLCASFLNFPILLFFVAYSHKILPAIIRSFVKLIF